MKNKKRLQKAKDAMNNFSARGSKCPLCGKQFRHGCNHSVLQAEERLFENYIKALTLA